MALYVKFECATCENENCYGHSLHTTEKVCDGYKHTATNADRIRSMTDEELAEWMAINTDCFFCKVKNKNICSLDERTCPEEWMSWLKAPVEEGET